MSVTGVSTFSNSKSCFIIKDSMCRNSRSRLVTRNSLYSNSRSIGWSSFWNCTCEIKFLTCRNWSWYFGGNFTLVYPATDTPTWPYCTCHSCSFKSDTTISICDHYCKGPTGAWRDITLASLDGNTGFINCDPPCSCSCITDGGFRSTQTTTLLGISARFWNNFATISTGSFPGNKGAGL